MIATGHARLRPENGIKGAEMADKTGVKNIQIDGSAQEFVEVANWRGFESSALSAALSRVLGLGWWMGQR